MFNSHSLTLIDRPLSLSFSQFFFSCIALILYIPHFDLVHCFTIDALLLLSHGTWFEEERTVLSIFPRAGFNTDDGALQSELESVPSLLSLTHLSSRAERSPRLHRQTEAITSRWCTGSIWGPRLYISPSQGNNNSMNNITNELNIADRAFIFGYVACSTDNGEEVAIFHTQKQCWNGDTQSYHSFLPLPPPWLEGETNREE